MIWRFQNFWFLKSGTRNRGVGLIWGGGLLEWPKSDQKWIEYVQIFGQYAQLQICPNIGIQIILVQSWPTSSWPCRTWSSPILDESARTSAAHVLLQTAVWLANACSNVSGTCCAGAATGCWSNCPWGYSSSCAGCCSSWFDLSDLSSWFVGEDEVESVDASPIFWLKRGDTVSWGWSRRVPKILR